jgi:hypothetical protein
MAPKALEDDNSKGDETNDDARMVLDVPSHILIIIN